MKLFAVLRTTIWRVLLCAEREVSLFLANFGTRNFETNIPRKGIAPASVPISTFMCLRAIYIFPRSVCRKMCMCTDLEYLFWEYINRIFVAVLVKKEEWKNEMKNFRNVHLTHTFRFLPFSSDGSVNPFEFCTYNYTCKKDLVWRLFIKMVST